MKQALFALLVSPLTIVAGGQSLLAQTLTEIDLASSLGEYRGAMRCRLLGEGIYNMEAMHSALSIEGGELHRDAILMLSNRPARDALLDILLAREIEYQLANCPIQFERYRQAN
jgi:hypothetical protein